MYKYLFLGVRTVRHMSRVSLYPRKLISPALLIGDACSSLETLSVSLFPVTLYSVYPVVTLPREGLRELSPPILLLFRFTLVHI